MPNANEARQARHDRCKRLTKCPTCHAPPGRSCYVVVRMNGHVYSPVTFAKQIEHAAMSTGKTMTQTAVITGLMMRSDWGKEMGGLHAARWRAETTADVVTRLGDVAHDAS